jgi:hypothetical protein
MALMSRPNYTIGIIHRAVAIKIVAIPVTQPIKRRDAHIAVVIEEFDWNITALLTSDIENGETVNTGVGTGVDCKEMTASCRIT